MSHDATERIFPLCSLRGVVMYIHIHKNQLSIMYVNYAAYCTYFLMGWNAWTKVLIRIDITCIINHRLVFIPRIPHQSMLILDTNYRKLFLHGRSIHKHCLPKKSVQNNWKSQQLLSHGMPLLNAWMYCIVLFAFPATTPYKTPPAIGHLESLDYRTSRARGHQAKGKWVAPLFFEKNLNGAKTKKESLRLLW